MYILEISMYLKNMRQTSKYLLALPCARSWSKVSQTQRQVRLFLRKAYEGMVSCWVSEGE